MRYLKFSYKGQKGIGLLEDNCVYPLMNNDSWIKSMIVFLEENYPVKRGESISLDEVKILSPIEYPRRNIICLGKNYREHALEMKGKITDAVVVPDYPIYFSKACNKTIGDGDIITGHKGVSEMVDYEVELAIIIGKEGVNIPKNQVKDHIFGYTIANDVSARDLQKDHFQWLKGKSLDGFCPLGPVVIDKNDVMYPPSLGIKCFVNDELRQSAKTDELIFDIDTIVSDLSKGMTLLPGDIILTGTPSGVGMGFKPPKYLSSGDVIKCEIEKIGILINSLE